jgi:hypothetical protein
MAKVQFTTDRTFEVAFAELNCQRAEQNKKPISKKAFIGYCFDFFFSPEVPPAEGDKAEVFSFFISKIRSNGK